MTKSCDVRVSFDSLAEGNIIPELVRQLDALDLFMFSAASWLLHRIHYDPHYAEAEGHQRLLIQGPFQGVLMVQALRRWLDPTARLIALSYRHLAPAYLGDELRASGRVMEKNERDRTVLVEVWVNKDDQTKTTVGEARISFSTIGAESQR